MTVHKYIIRDVTRGLVVNWNGLRTTRSSVQIPTNMRDKKILLADFFPFVLALVERVIGYLLLVGDSSYLWI